MGGGWGGVGGGGWGAGGGWWGGVGGGGVGGWVGGRRGGGVGGGDTLFGVSRWCHLLFSMVYRQKIYDIDSPQPQSFLKSKDLDSSMGLGN